MYAIRTTPRFKRDVKACEKKHWNMDALKKAVMALSQSDSKKLDLVYKDHALTGKLKGYRSIHIDAAPNPPKDTWVLMYLIANGELFLVRTGTHEAVYG